MYRVVQFFYHYHIPNEEKVIHVFYHLDEEALICFQDCEHDIVGWNEFVRAYKNNIFIEIILLHCLFNRSSVIFI